MSDTAASAELRSIIGAAAYERFEARLANAHRRAEKIRHNGRELASEAFRCGVLNFREAMQAYDRKERKAERVYAAVSP